MSDLISRSALIERIKTHSDFVKSGKRDVDAIYTLAHEHIIELIEKQPTAYSIEKVVAELEEASKPLGFGLMPDSRYIAESKAIDIVKRGGVDD